MPVHNEAALVSLDAEGALALVRERAGDDLLAAGEYTPEGFNLLYLADELLAQYGGESQVWDIGKAVHGYIHVDFEERRLFEDLYPTVEETYAFVTHTNFALIARVIAGDEGLYFTFRPGTEASGIVEAVASEVLDAT